MAITGGTKPIGRLAALSFEQLFDTVLSDFSNRYPSKPQMVSEFASACDNGCDKAAWIADAYEAMKQYVNLRAVVWFNEAKYEGTNYVDWRIWCAEPCINSCTSGVPQGSCACLQAYQTAVAQPNFSQEAPYMIPLCHAYNLIPDTVIDLADINDVLFNSIFFGAAYDARFDLVPDGVIDIADIFAVALHYGESCP